jgi:WD repeat-containing protein 45
VGFQILLFFLINPLSNRLSALRQVAAFVPGTNYLNSEWSYAQYRLPTPSAHQAHSLSTTNRLGTAHPDAGDEERWTVGWITLAPDTTPQSSPAKGPIGLPSIHKGKGRANQPGSPLRGAAERPSPLSPSFKSSRPRVKQPTQPEYQLIALTFTGGWYRLSLPHPNEPADRAGTPEPYQGKKRPNPRPGESKTPTERSGSPQLAAKRLGDQRKHGDASKRRSSDAQVADTSRCHLEEFRRFGRWDGWG